MALNIKNARVERLATEVAQMARETKTEAIRRALEDRKARLAFKTNPQDNRDTNPSLRRRAERKPFL